MQKLTWIDADTASALEDEFDGLEDNQAFLEQFLGISLLLDALNSEEFDAGSIAS